MNINSLFFNGTVLIIEDDAVMRDGMKSYFSKKCRKVFVAQDGKEGLTAYKEHRPDVIYCDIGLPLLNGLDLLKEIRRKDQKSILCIMTAHLKEEYLLEATTLHLENFITKPITYNKLEESLKHIIRISEKGEVPICKEQGLYYSYRSKTVLIRNKEVHLTDMEIRLLEILISKEGGIATYDMLDNELYQEQNRVMSRSAIKTLVKRVRKKLEGGALILNKSDVGYYLKCN